MTDLPSALMVAVGKTALAKHREKCIVCSDEYVCAVAKVHLDTIARLTADA